MSESLEPGFFASESSATGGRRAARLLGTAAGAALLAAGMAACSNSPGSSGAAPHPLTTVTAGAPAPAPGGTGAPPAGATPASSQGNGPAPSAGQGAPSPIGPLVVSPDQSIAQQILKEIQASGSEGQALAVVYQDSSNDTKRVVVAGGSGLPLPPGSAATKLGAIIVSDQPRSAKFSGPEIIDPGQAGGTSECVEFLARNLSYHGVARCAWINGQDSLSMTFENYSPDEAAGLAPQIINAFAGGN